MHNCIKKKIETGVVLIFRKDQNRWRSLRHIQVYSATFPDYLMEESIIHLARHYASVVTVRKYVAWKGRSGAHRQNMYGEAFTSREHIRKHVYWIGGYLKVDLKVRRVLLALKSTEIRTKHSWERTDIHQRSYSLIAALVQPVGLVV